MKTLSELINEWQEEKKAYSIEGSTGIANLCKLCGALGYEDRLGRMGTYGEARLGNLIDFLEDNSGVIEAMITWIGDQECQEWKDSIESELPPPAVKDAYEEGVCPDCQDEIPDEAVEGEECSNCGHVFWHQRADDIPDEVDPSNGMPLRGE